MLSVSSKLVKMKVRLFSKDALNRVQEIFLWRQEVEALPRQVVEDSKNPKPT